MADTQASIIALAKTGDLTAVKRARDLENIAGTFPSRNERDRFAHSIQAILHGALGGGARSPEVDGYK